MVNGTTIRYNGYFQFLTMSIHNILHIALREFQQINEKIIHFSNAKRRIEMKYFDEIYHLLWRKQLEFA